MRDLELDEGFERLLRRQRPKDTSTNINGVDGTFALISESIPTSENPNSALAEGVPTEAPRIDSLPLSQNSEDFGEPPLKKRRVEKRDRKSSILDGVLKYLDKTYDEQRRQFASRVAQELDGGAADLWKFISCRVDLSIMEPNESGSPILFF